MSFIERRSCPVCENLNLTILLDLPYSNPIISTTLQERYHGKITEKDFYQANYVILECNTCSLIFQKFVPDDELASRIYTYEQSRVEKSLSKKRNAPVDYFSRYSNIAKKISILLDKFPHFINVLDFGSGWGYFLEMAKAYGFNTTGIEISEERKLYCEENKLRIKSSLDELEETYDFIYSDQTFEHISEPLPYLKKLVTKLNPGGIVYIHVPNCKNTKLKLKNFNKIIDDIFPLEHVNGFNNKSLKKFAGKANLEIIPASEIFQKEIKRVTLTQNADLLQDSLKAFYNQNKKTELYFRVKRA